MARGRIISKSIPSSKKMTMLSCDSARLTYLYLYTQVDDEGRIEGDAFLLRSLLFQRDEGKTKEEIEQWLVEMHNAGLIIRYFDENTKDWCIQIADFKEYNWIRSDRFKPSKFPDPPKELLKNISKESEGSQLEDTLSDSASPSGQPQYNLSKTNIIKSKLSKNYGKGIPKELQ